MLIGKYFYLNNFIAKLKMKIICRNDAEISISLALNLVYLLSLVLQPYMPTTSDEIRRASVITFKNFIKRNWPSLDQSNTISIRDRNHIKEHIIDLMIRSPEYIQEQLSDAITVIGKCDFPDHWTTLLDTMIKQFQQQSSNSFQSINGILKCNPEVNTSGCFF